MTANSVKDKIHHAMVNLAGVTYEPHRYGGIEYKLGKREIGHIHRDNLVDIPFPIKVRDEVFQNGDAEIHHVLPDSGWVSIHIHNDDDVERAINLLKRSYDIAVEQMKRRKQ